MTHYYFAYGRNTNLNDMEHRCPGAVRMGNAWIDGYAFKWRSAADIELLSDPSDNYVVGVLWELSGEHLANLDKFEEYPSYYFRQRVIAKTGQQEYVSWAYMMVNQGDESMPGDEYRTALFEGYDQNHLSTDQMELGLKRLNG
jgi:gamma-glutamylcyclotransferase (GGCT)/AIG2-like uncharacterized protein YtfP